jgi:formate dehydrogenase major subunit
MTKSNGQKPVGYGHDNKGAAGGTDYREGKPGVAHTAPVDKIAGKGEGERAKTFSIDDREVEIRPGETIFNAAGRLGIELPHLCYSPKPGYRPDGNCRVCMVEIEGERVLAASCIRTARSSLVFMPTSSPWKAILCRISPPSSASSSS